MYVCSPLGVELASLLTMLSHDVISVVAEYTFFGADVYIRNRDGKTALNVDPAHPRCARATEKCKLIIRKHLDAFDLPMPYELIL